MAGPARSEAAGARNSLASVPVIIAPWGMQRAGFCSKLIAKKRIHEKEDIFYCSAAGRGSCNRILWEQKLWDLR